MIILQSQISEIDLDTLHLELSSLFIQTLFIELETLHLDITAIQSPSLGLIQLEKLTLTLTPKVIPASVAIVVALGIASLTYAAKTIGYMEETGYAIKDLITVLRQGGTAPVTPPRFTDCDQMDLIDAFRAGSAQPSIPYDSDDMISSLLHALDLGNPVPFEVPVIGSWCGTQDWPDYLPEFTPIILLISDNVVPFNQDYSNNYGASFADHPVPTIYETTGASSIINLIGLGSGKVLLSSMSPTGTIFRSTDFGMHWVAMNISEFTASYIDCMAEYNKTGLCLLSTGYTGSNVSLLKSTNFGASFSQISLTNTVQVASIDFIDASNILMGRRSSTAAAIMKSIDAGATWVSKLSLNDSGALPKVVYCGDGICVAAPGILYSGDADYQKIYRSTDYGETWSYVTLSFDNRYTYFLLYLGSGILIMCCNYGKIYRSADYGLTWTKVYSGDSKDSMNLINLGNGKLVTTEYSTGSWHWIITSADYGLTWTKNPTRIDCDKIAYIT